MELGYYDILIRIAAALVAGGAVGYEREKRGRDAGFRTHVLVTVGSCLFTLIELEGISRVIQFAAANEAQAGSVTVSLHRLTAQIITGIGFLGTGTIIVTKRSIKGLTTAASIWVCAALGIAAGYGYYLIVGTGTVSILLILLAIKRIFSFPDMKVFRVVYQGQPDLAGQLELFFRSRGIKVLGSEVKFQMEDGVIIHEIDYHIDSRRIQSQDQFMTDVSTLGIFEEQMMRTIGDEQF